MADLFKEAIKKHLDQKAKSDLLFAITYAKGKKNIDDCCTYIINEVKKSGRQGFADEEVFNMAIHYYDEDTIAVGKPTKAKVVVNHTADKIIEEVEEQEEENEEIQEPIQKPKIQANADKKGQISLF
jgi:hypothetical protein